MNISMNRTLTRMILPAARRLKLNDPRVVKKYLEHLHHAIEVADMYQDEYITLKNCLSTTTAFSR
jgi:hypothetical protein